MTDHYHLPQVVLLGGLGQSGKSTCASFLVNSHDYTPVKMAGPLKAMLTALMRSQGARGYEVHRFLEGDLKEELNPYLANQTTRHAMQTLGTEWGRDCMCPDFWRHLAVKRVETILGDGGRVVIDDIRFPNELEAFTGLGATSVYISRENIRTPVKNHLSERLLNPEDFHAELTNDGTLAELRSTLMNILRGGEGWRPDDEGETWAEPQGGRCAAPRAVTGPTEECLCKSCGYDPQGCVFFRENRPTSS